MYPIDEFLTAHGLQAGGVENSIWTDIWRKPCGSSGVLRGSLDSCPFLECDSYRVTGLRQDKASGRLRW